MNQDQFISKARLLKAIERSRLDNHHSDPKVRANHNYEHDHFSYMVLNAPTIDVRPVERGRWVSQPYAKYECSNCGFYEVPMPYDICPHCGATMDGEVNPDDQR